MSQIPSENSLSTRRCTRLGKKIFDLAAAREALPLVRMVASDLLTAHHAVLSLNSRCTGAQSSGDKFTAWRLSDELENAHRQVNRLTQELKELHVHFQNSAQGEIGFPSIVNGALAYLVLRNEDDDIYFWRYCDQPRLREIPRSWYKTPATRVAVPECPELVLLGPAAV